jgi:hypothetical protein
MSDLLDLRLPKSPHFYAGFCGCNVSARYRNPTAEEGWSDLTDCAISGSGTDSSVWISHVYDDSLLAIL